MTNTSEVMMRTTMNMTTASITIQVVLRDWGGPVVWSATNAWTVTALVSVAALLRSQVRFRSMLIDRLWVSAAQGQGIEQRNRQRYILRETEVCWFRSRLLHPASAQTTSTTCYHDSTAQHTLRSAAGADIRVPRYSNFCIRNGGDFWRCWGGRSGAVSWWFAVSFCGGFLSAGCWENKIRRVFYRSSAAVAKQWAASNVRWRLRASWNVSCKRSVEEMLGVTLKHMALQERKYAFKVSDAQIIVDTRTFIMFKRSWLRRWRDSHLNVITCCLVLVFWLSHKTPPNTTSPLALSERNRVLWRAT